MMTQVWFTYFYCRMYPSIMRYDKSGYGIETFILIITSVSSTSELQSCARTFELGQFYPRCSLLHFAN